MASEQGGTNDAISAKKKMTADYGQRAALALDRLTPNRNRNKAVERIFLCCPREARNLRNGLHWTIDRLNQASAVLGAAFDALLAGTPANEAVHTAEMLEIAARLARIEERFDDAVVGKDAPVIPPTRGTSIDGPGREVPPTSREAAAAGCGQTTFAENR
jgi:hypothetical protein